VVAEGADTLGEMTAPRARPRSSVARDRMVGLGLWGAAAADPAAVVAGLVAMQAQEHAYARWSVGQRCGASASVVDAAFDAGELLRTHVLRPTWHYAAPADLRWLLGLTGGRIDAANARRYAQLGLDARTCRRSTDLIAAAVTEGPMTRHELAAMLAHNRVAPDGQRMPHLLLHAELHLAVVSGPMHGNQHTYVPFDDRVPPGPRFTEDEALEQLARRWFTTRGPASVRDFAWWSGLPAGHARRALSAVQAELSSFERDGIEYWFAEVHRGVRRPRIDLVQCYDEAIISYSETRSVLTTDDVTFKVPGSTAGFTHVLLGDGQLLGHWRVRRVPRGGIEIDTRLARAIDDRERAALTAAVARYEDFLRT
jgi:hypothetical protein